MTEHIKRLAALLDCEEDLWATTEDCEPYLMRFGKIDGGMRNNLVVMSDRGLTWEPYRTYPTPKMGQLVGNLESDVAECLRVLDEWYGK